MTISTCTVDEESGECWLIDSLQQRVAGITELQSDLNKTLTPRLLNSTSEVSMFIALRLESKNLGLPNNASALIWFNAVLGCQPDYI